jgi:pimeloyl-ACP methyl ester carboxylesterase
MKKYYLSTLFIFGLFFSTLAQPFAIGSVSTTYVDPDRGNRNIPSEVFYPALTSGSNAPLADGVFPVVVVGHGFAMTYAAYQFLWEALVPLGYIVALPKTESSIFPAPSHSNFGLDMAFLVNEIKAAGLDVQSQFYGKVAANAALIGHSMGGGASFLGAANNENIAAVIGFAPAETNPSAIAAAAGVSASTLIFAGSNDCVTPPAQHQIPIYENVPDGRKMLVTVNGGGHCFFADYNFFCSVGEGSCSPSPAITRAEQQNITLSILIPFLDFQLKGSFEQWQNFNSQLNNQPVEVENGWADLPQLNQLELNAGWNSISFPAIPIDKTFANLFGEVIPYIVYFTDGAINFDVSNLPENYFIDSETGFLLKVSQAVTLNFAGFSLEGRSFQLSEGWNLMPFLKDQNSTVIGLFGKTAENLIVKEVAGTNVFWYQKSLSSLSILEPGKSYMIWTEQGFEVVF